MYATLCCPGSPELQLFLIVIDKVFIRITLLFYVARCLLLGVCCLLWLFVVRSLLLTVDCNQRYLILFLLIQLTYCYCCLFVVYCCCCQISVSIVRQKLYRPSQFSQLVMRLVSQSLTLTNNISLKFVLVQTIFNLNLNRFVI